MPPGSRLSLPLFFKTDSNKDILNKALVPKLERGLYKAEQT